MVGYQGILEVLFKIIMSELQEAPFYDQILTFMNDMLTSDFIKNYFFEVSDSIAVIKQVLKKPNVNQAILLLNNLLFNSNFSIIPQNK